METNLNVATVLFGFNRPELIDRRLTELQSIKPKHLLVAIDYFDATTTQAFRELADKYIATWPTNSEIKFKFQTSNLGLARHIPDTISNLLLDFENVIVIEDDIKISPIAFENFIFGLNYIQSRDEYASVGAFSPLVQKSRKFAFNYFRKSIYFSCWGWATNRKSWIKYEQSIKFEKIEEELRYSKSWKELSKLQKKVWIDRFKKISSYPDHTWDIQMQYVTFKHDLSHLIPIFRFADNEGFADSRSTHTKGARPRWMFSVEPSKARICNVLRFGLIVRILEIIDSETMIGDRKTLRFLSKLR